MAQINIRREKGVVGTSTSERVMERFLSMNVFRAPDGQAEADLAGDTFHYMYKSAPKILDDVPAERSVNQAVLKWLDSTNPDRSKTSGRITTALAAAGVMWAGLTQDSTIKEALEKQKEADEAAKEAEQAEKQAQQVAKQAAGQPGGMTAQQQQAIADAMAKAREARGKADAAGAAAQQKIEDAANHPIKKFALQKATKAAEEAADKVDSVMKTWGIGEGDLSHNDAQEIINMSRQANLEDLTKMFGRYRGMAKQVIANVRTGKTGSVPEVDETRDFSRMFDSEASQMSGMMPLPIRLSAIQRFISRGLMGFVPQEEGTENGSFLVYADESGSIGTRLCSMIKAMCLGIAAATRDEIQENRPWEMYGFAYEIVGGVNDRDDWRNLIRWATSCDNGGTSIDAVLEHAIDRLSVLHDSEIRDVDIVFITDGEAEIDATLLARFNEARAAMGTRFIYLHIGYGVNQVLKDCSDLFIHAQSTSDFKSMADDILVQVAGMIANH